MRPGAEASQRLLLFNLATDEDDPILGFASDWIRALARRAAAVDVVTMRRGTFDAPDNVRVFSVGKERGFTEARRGLEFYRVLTRLLRSGRYDGCFAHMMPLFALMGAPLLKQKRIPTTLWYVHGSTSAVLRAATWTVDRVVTASPGSFPLVSPKVITTGHGIDTQRFVPSDTDRGTRPFTILTVGRVAPIKNVHVLVDAVAEMYRSSARISVQVVGPTLEVDAGYAAEVQRQIHDLDLQDIVRFVGPVHPAAMVDRYRAADACVNLSDTDSMDKAVLEAMSCGVPVVTSNAECARLVATVSPLLAVPKGRPGDVARACSDLHEMSIDERRSIGTRLRELVVHDHDLEVLMDRLVDDVLFRPVEA